MSSGNRSFFAPQETRVELPHGASNQTPDITRPASPSENERASFLNGGASNSRDDARMGAKAVRNEEKPAVGILALAPILSYCAASITMTVVNKFTVSGAGFNMNLLVLLIQSTVGVTCVMIAERFGLIQLRGLNKKDAWNWMPLSTMLVFVIWTGSKALQYLNISVYTIFKNLTIILIAYGEVMWFGGKVTRIVLSSFLLMVLSSVIAAWSDISNVFAIGNLSMPHTPDSISGGMSKDPVTGALIPAFDPLQAEKDAINAQITGTSANDVIEGFQGYGLLSSGYLWMALNCICSATYVLLMRKRIKVTGFKDWDTMFYNNFLSIPVLLIMSLLVEDWSAANLHKNFPDDKQTKLISAIVFSGACAILISYTTAWCIRATSSTTYSMVGALNKLPVALSGMVFFHDPPVTFSSVSAITVGFVAGCVYAMGKNKQAEAAKLASNSSANGSSGVAGPKESLPLHSLNDRKH
ncbi:probable VRG4 - Golgi GDP-mannose transporter [Melanopsichium pennsylvanicum]|uniref:GDP-mannose transporter n=2 Tax=Melanopsichium pennsylvanicum TaxID=63383 RepID=A0AAJ5C3D3_9BASI|nr:probable VRG4-Golgi GDP-mannose transporter [Melanopsichium pennsylvanicum 4]SNX82408.1 probable VRG4 - Golgi GDP-mannose transporter [Melanopsichium pennsylvanicum]